MLLFGCVVAFYEELVARNPNDFLHAKSKLGSLGVVFRARRGGEQSYLTVLK